MSNTTDNVTPLVSVYMTTYNHEKYILQALNSVKMQLTSFPIEVLVGEDCSTDSTRKVLQEFEKSAPSYFHIYYREKNMNKEFINNSADLISRCKGKYLIALEGDDYWLDSHKLQKQVDFLENHPDYVAVAHNCLVVDDDSKIKENVYYPECLETEYTIEHYIASILPGQLATVMYRNGIDSSYVIRAMIPESERKFLPGDRLLYFRLLCNGKVYCMQETMSAYRYVPNGNSWTATHKFQPRTALLAQYKALMKYAEIKHKTYIYTYVEMDYLRFLRQDFKQKRIGTFEYLKYLLLMKRKFALLFIALKWHFKDTKTIHSHGCLR